MTSAYDQALATLRAARGFLLDMDGTIYVDEKLVPGALDFIAHLRRHDKQFLFLTNNSSASAVQYQERLHRLGIDVPLSQVMTSGDATIGHVLDTTPYRSAYVVGTPAFVADVQTAGIDTAAMDPDCVIVGFDKTLTFDKLERACTLLFAGKPYFATHPDKTCITLRGLIPDIAAIIAACEAVTGRVPVIVGKPEKPIVDAGLRRLGLTAGEVAMVGDQLDTDMTMALTSGLSACLVMSGETTPAKLSSWPENRRPVLQFQDISKVYQALA